MHRPKIASFSLVKRSSFQKVSFLSRDFDSIGPEYVCLCMLYVFVCTGVCMFVFVHAYIYVRMHVCM